MLGRQPGHLMEVHEVDIHGAKFYDLIFTLDASPEHARSSRIGQESVYENPHSGDAVTLHMVLGQVTKVERRAV